MSPRRLCTLMAMCFSLLCISLVALATQPVPEPGAEAPTAGVTLLDVGQGDLRQLRWTPRAGEPIRAKLSMQMDMDLSFDGQAMPKNQLPRIVFTLRVEAGEPDADGNFPVSTTYEAIGLEGETNPMMRRAMLDAMKPLEGATLAFVMTPLGVTTSTNTAELPPQVLEMLGGQAGARQMIESIAQPMPEQAIGVGARWRLVQRVGGVNSPVVTTVATYELVRRDGAVIELRMTGEQTGKEQDFDLPAPGGTARLLSADGSFEGSSTLRLDSLVPLAARNEGRSMFKFRFTEGGVTQVVEQTLGVELTIERLEEVPATQPE